MTGGRVIVAQLGARMHYAVPRILHAEGRLAHFYTDICATSGWPRMLAGLPSSMLPRGVRRLVGRVLRLPASRITSFSWLGLSFAIRRARADTPTAATEAHLWAGRRLSQCVRRDFGRHGHPEATHLYAFSGECLELLREARSRGLKTIVEQINAPRGILDKLVEEERRSFPDWVGVPEPDARSESYALRETMEWAAADLVVCGSDFVRAGVIASGGDPNRTVVVPYGVDLRAGRREPRRRGDGPLRVLTVGGVGLRKGSPYVLEAARRLRGVAEFRLVGGLDVSHAARSRLAEAATLTGAVPRSEIAAHYDWADVFLLPSICEGSATVIYEALACGLPVVTTPNSGSVVRQGVDGFVTPIRDPDAIEAALRQLAGDGGLYLKMAENAFQRGREFGLRDYGRRLIEALDHPCAATPSATKAA
ncbi:glycosyltransferase family 4 protein [Chenggangzhangella methanolivorans]|uniref:Glycosyltransferase family 4 protein n=1 Tax=Chenggangzhangella methanolivorans TaxID=1437009 RepID=A0A9E6RDF3_9HYPH|nr:glycosyltransferase family 4 protein [Chenggangzhangella methanolivorans]QZO01284.1 glycosyltransferase family 4 protein [Chenggangzhangella methanolivorans]